MAISIFFAGDVVATKGEETALVSSELEQYIKACDLACLNFEAPITTKNQKKIPKIGPSISQDKAMIDRVKNAGFGLVTLANNHIMDYGVDGLKATIHSLDEKGIAHIGAGDTIEDIMRAHYIVKDELKVGIISVAEKGFGVALQENEVGYAWFGHEAFKQKLRQLLVTCTHTIVVCHGGAEGWDVPLPEFRKLYKSWIDMGASAVIAHHPHVPQGFEQYGAGVIFYSLGNFMFNKGTGIINPDTICVKLDIANNLLDYEVIHTKCTEAGIVINEQPYAKAHLEECNKILQSEVHMKIVNEACVKAFHKMYKNYYSAVSNVYRGGIKQIIKTILFRYIKREKFSNLWLYHNLQIETHYWICRRALDLIGNKEL